GYYRAQIALMPKDAWVHGNYASFLLFQRGDFENAIKQAREALAIMEYGNARTTLAIALYTKWADLLVNQKRPEEAKAFFDEAKNLFPDLHEVLRMVQPWPPLTVTVKA